MVVVVRCIEVQDKTAGIGSISNKKILHGQGNLKGDAQPRWACALFSLIGRNIYVTDGRPATANCEGIGTRGGVRIQV